MGCYIVGFAVGRAKDPRKSKDRRGLSGQRKVHVLENVVARPRSPADGWPSRVEEYC